MCVESLSAVAQNVRRNPTSGYLGVVGRGRSGNDQGGVGPRTDPRLVEVVSTACAAAIEDHPEAAFYLRDLGRSVAERNGVADGSGAVLRLERWWDDDPDYGGPLTCQLIDISEALDAVSEQGQALSDLINKGFHDASDPSQPMASILVVAEPLEPGQDIDARAQTLS